MAPGRARSENGAMAANPHFFFKWLNFSGLPYSIPKKLILPEHIRRNIFHKYCRKGTTCLSLMHSMI